MKTDSFLLSAVVLDEFCDDDATCDVYYDGDIDAIGVDAHTDVSGSVCAFAAIHRRVGA